MVTVRNQSNILFLSKRVDVSVLIISNAESGFAIFK